MKFEIKTEKEGISVLSLPVRYLLCALVNGAPRVSLKESAPYHESPTITRKKRVCCIVSMDTVLFLLAEQPVLLPKRRARDLIAIPRSFTEKSVITRIDSSPALRTYAGTIRIGATHRLPLQIKYNLEGVANRTHYDRKNNAGLVSKHAGTERKKNKRTNNKDEYYGICNTVQLIYQAMR